MLATALAPYTRAASPDHTVWLGDVLTTVLATGEDTDGAFAVVEVTAPRDHMVPPHTHADEIEAFYVIEGSVAFTVDGRDVAGRSGTWALVPPRTVHTFRVESERARMLVLMSRAGFERFFLELGTPVASLDEAPPVGEPDVPRLVATAAKYGCEFLPPAG